MKIIKNNINFEDDRGFILDLINYEKINSVTRISFNRNKVRGNHYHKKTFQWNFVLFGEIVLFVKSKTKTKKILFKKNDLFLLEPNEHHALKALKKSEILVFTKGPRGGKEYEKDTYRLKVKLI